MRLIDADTLRAEFPIPEDITDPNQALVHITGIWAEIDNAPTIEERKMGKWIIKNTNSRVTTYKCSECGRIVRDDTGYDVSKDYPYCHCGSDMRGNQK